MSLELKALTDQLQNEWKEFRSENDRRLKELEKTGRTDPLTEEKIDKHSLALGELQKSLDGLAARMNRPGAGPAVPQRTEHQDAFVKYIRKGDSSLLEGMMTKDLSIGVGTDGGFAVPEELDRTIAQQAIDASPMAGLVNSITAGNELYEKLIDLRGTASGWVGETTARPATATPTFASFVPSFGELYAFPFSTQRMLEDAFFDVEAWLSSSIAEKFTQDIDAAIITGDGVNKPKGVLAYPLAATPDASRPYGTIEKRHSGTSADFDADDLIDLFHTMKPAYRQFSTWVMATLTLAKVRKFKGSDGQYIWQPALTAGDPSILLGRPVVEDENVPAVGAGSHSVLIADWNRAYKLVTIRGISVLRDPYTVKGKVGFYARTRLGGGVEDTSAVKVLTLAV